MRQLWTLRRIIALALSVAFVWGLLSTGLVHGNNARLFDSDDGDWADRGQDECTGATCEFRDSCGKARLNPMTSKRRSSSVNKPFIVNGEPQVYGEFPSYVRISYSYYDVYAKKRESKSCGGVLVSDRHILTAAHCMHTPYGAAIKAHDVTVILADDTRYKDPYEVRYEGVESICVASNFRRQYIGKVNHIYYDFAVLTLKEEVKFNDYVQPACLPYPPHGLAPGDITPCFVVGAGAKGLDSKGDPILPSSIQKIPVLTGDCLPPFFHDTSRMCFKHVNDTGNACVGDSGGPLLCLFPNKRWVVGGLVSYGPPDCKPYEEPTADNPWLAVAVRVVPILKHIKYDCKL